MCELCNDKGWILTMNLNLLQWTIEKCDECNIFPDDESAGEVKQTKIYNNEARPETLSH